MPQLPVGRKLGMGLEKVGKVLGFLGKTSAQSWAYQYSSGTFLPSIGDSSWAIIMQMVRWAAIVGSR